MIIDYVSVKTCFRNHCINYFAFLTLLSQVNGYVWSTIQAHDQLLWLHHTLLPNYLSFQIKFYYNVPASAAFIKWIRRVLYRRSFVYLIWYRRAPCRMKGTQAELGCFAAVVCAL